MCYDALQLTRIELMLSQLIQILVKQSLNIPPYVESFVVPEPLDEPVLHDSPDAPRSHFVSKSKMRRLRASRTRSKMWTSLHAQVERTAESSSSSTESTSENESDAPDADCFTATMSPVTTTASEQKLMAPGRQQRPKISICLADNGDPAVCTSF